LASKTIGYANDPFRDQSSEGLISLGNACSMASLSERVIPKSWLLSTIHAKEQVVTTVCKGPGARWTTLCVAFLASLAVTPGLRRNQTAFVLSWANGDINKLVEKGPQDQGA
jgi:hypothetical protein